MLTGQQLSSLVHRDLHKQRLDAEANNGVYAGVDRVNNNTPRTGEWFALTALADTVFGAVISPNSTNLNGMTLPKGMTLSVFVTSFTLVSGDVLAYKL